MIVVHLSNIEEREENRDSPFRFPQLGVLWTVADNGALEELSEISSLAACPFSGPPCMTRRFYVPRIRIGSAKCKNMATNFNKSEPKLDILAFPYFPSFFDGVLDRETYSTIRWQCSDLLKIYRDCLDKLQQFSPIHQGILISTGAFFGLPYLANRFGITAEGEFVFWTDTVGLAAFAVLGARIAACLPDHHVHAGRVSRSFKTWLVDWTISLEVPAPFAAWVLLVLAVLFGTSYARSHPGSYMLNMRCMPLQPCLEPWCVFGWCAVELWLGGMEWPACARHSLKCRLLKTIMVGVHAHDLLMISPQPYIDSQHHQPPRIGRWTLRACCWVHGWSLSYESWHWTTACAYLPSQQKWRPKPPSRSVIRISTRLRDCFRPGPRPGRYDGWSPLPGGSPEGLLPVRRPKRRNLPRVMIAGLGVVERFGNSDVDDRNDDDAWASAKPVWWSLTDMQWEDAKIFVRLLNQIFSFIQLRAAMKKGQNVTTGKHVVHDADNLLGALGNLFCKTM